MTDHKIKFSGFADIYLQGVDALQPLEDEPGYMTYYLGCAVSNILIQDHRLEAAKAARLALNGHDEGNFADVFNFPAWVDIQEEQRETKIFLHDKKINGEERSILWLGILYNQNLDENGLFWKLVKPITDSITAFAAIIP